MDTRINVYTDDGQLDSWFRLDRATEIQEGRWHDGSNWISKATNDQFDHETLYRTAQGRWVLHKWSQCQGTRHRWRFIGDEQARGWLLQSDLDEQVERYFGQSEKERGPGRPEIGPRICFRVTDELLARLDNVAKQEGMSRAETARRRLAAALEQSPVAGSADPR